MTDSSLQHVVIYTDGACSPNPGTGGWGAVLISQKHQQRKELSGAEADTTNNRMELTAAVEALSALKQPCRVELYTDSSYLRNAFEQKWLQNWQLKTGGPVAVKRCSTATSGKNCSDWINCTRSAGIGSKPMRETLKMNVPTPSQLPPVKNWRPNPEFPTNFFGSSATSPQFVTDSTVRRH